MRTAIVLLGATALLSAALVAGLVDAQTRGDRFRVRGTTDNEEPTPTEAARLPVRRFTEAPTGFDSLTNGYLPQGPAFDTLDEDTVKALRSFNDNRFLFEETEKNSD